jgi:hypothetical protein
MARNNFNWKSVVADIEYEQERRKQELACCLSRVSDEEQREIDNVSDDDMVA